MLKNPFNLEGLVGLVTGAGRGLGLEVALALANAGADIVVAEIDQESGAEAARQLEQLGRRVLFVPTDVTKFDSIEAAMGTTLETLGGLDIVVNNGGYTAL